jgi:hypothetical protein
MTRNWAEGIVRELLVTLAPSVPSFCTCAQCTDDVLLYVLNHVRPRYAAEGSVGGVVTRTTLDSDQERTELTVAVLQGMRQVAAAPRHPPAA